MMPISWNSISNKNEKVTYISSKEWNMIIFDAHADGIGLEITLWFTVMMVILVIVGSFNKCTGSA